MAKKGSFLARIHTSNTQKWNDGNYQKNQFHMKTATFIQKLRLKVDDSQRKKRHCREAEKHKKVREK